jgi:hypothetical protein
MSRYITCVVKDSSKTVKVYDSDGFLDTMDKLRNDNKGSFKVKYIRNIDREDGELYRYGQGAEQMQTNYSEKDIPLPRSANFYKYLDAE